MLVSMCVCVWLRVVGECVEGIVVMKSGVRGVENRLPVAVVNSSVIGWNSGVTVR